MRPNHPLAVALLVVTTTATAAGSPDSARLRDRVRAYRAGHEAAILTELAELLGIPNLASDRPNILRNAEHIKGLLVRRGVTVQLLEAEGSPPAIYGERTTPGARRTVLFYVHYDGQPVDRSRWASDPWTPVLRDGPLEDGGRERSPWYRRAAPTRANGACTRARRATTRLRSWAS
jgi:hypothetical protein